jgi:hypothetical protein
MRLRTTSSQCVLRTGGKLLEVPAASAAGDPGRLWLDNLYIAQEASDGGRSAAATMIAVGEGAQLWMTNVAVIGALPPDGVNATAPPPAVAAAPAGAPAPQLQLSRGLHALGGAQIYARSACPCCLHECSQGRSDPRVQCAPLLPAACTRACVR